MTRRKRDPKKEALVKEILDQYQPESEWEMLNTLKAVSYTHLDVYKRQHLALSYLK